MIQTFRTLTFFLILLTIACQPAPKGEIADLIYHNGTIITMEEEDAKITSVAVKDGKIIAVSEQSLVGMHRGDSTEVIDLQGKTLLPGFIDAHSHIAMAMTLVTQANISSPPVSGVKNIPDIIAKLKTQQEQHNIKKGEWIIGWGYDPDLLEEKRHPNKLDLDATFPDNPVFLLHVSGHMAVVNSTALAMVGIDAKTKDPHGGKIVRLPNSNEPSGLVQETASYVFRKALPVPTLQQLMVLLEEVQNLYASEGITTAQDGFTDFKSFQFLKQAAAAGKLKIDFECLASFQNLKEFLESYKTDFGKNINGLRLAGVKVISDGSPQGKTAFFTEPYQTEVPGCAHDCRGFPNLTKAELAAFMKQCYEADIQLYTHANGDGAIDLFLETHQSVTDSLPNLSDDLRSVIIHSQFVRPDQLDRYKKYNMIPAYFTNHAFFWGDVHLENLGEERASFLSPMKTTMDMGIVCTNHTDFIITPIDQLFLLWTAVNRKTRKGVVLGPEQRLSPMEGLKAITINAAYQHKQEAVKGSIKVGKLADFVILAENPLTVDADRIKDIKVLETIKEGEVIYTARE
jgi:predicted amidohydrolase YtcJ